jgi:hypothetical protein
MASFRGVHGAMLALESALQRALPAAWRQGQGTVNARVTLLGSRELAAPLAGNVIGLYLHRVTVDPFGRNRPLPPLPGPGPARVHAELPVNLHFLVIANGASAAIEADLLGWAMTALAAAPHLDLARLGESDPEWGRPEQAAITPAEMTDEDLLRLWDRFQASYTLSVPYVIRTVRLRLAGETLEGPDIATRVLPVGRPAASGATP